MHQPPGFVDSRYPHHVCLLQRFLYGLKQAPRALVLGFSGLQAMPLGLDFLLVAMILHCLSIHRVFRIIFVLTDLGALNYFLGISVVRHSSELFLSQKKYVLQLLERAHMVNCNPSRTPVDTDSKLGLNGVPVQDPTLYRSLARGL
ncbi:ribonuclease H-like domain-containing protein [Tanacetum coccineum]